MIPILYSADEKDFSTQGLGLLSDIQKADVTEQRNAEYYLEFSVPVFSKMFKEIKLERLVKVDDHNSEDQLFRIKKIDTPSKGLCDVYAEHISRDIEGYTINPEVLISGPANQALEIWKKNLVEKENVKIFSDILTNIPMKRWTIDEMENPFFCLGGKEGSILQLYKGEYQFDNLTVKLLKSRGFNTGASITYGRNMSDMKQDESIEELANSIYPFAWKEQESGESEKEREMIVLDPLYIDGPHIDKYAERRVMFVDFSDKKPKDKVALKKLAERYVKDNNIGAPKVGMDVSPILNGQIAKGLELEKFERVNLCDIVTVKYYQLGIDVQAKVNEVTYDVLAQKFSNYRLGDERRTLASSLGKIENSVSNVGKELGKVTGWAQQSADGKNTIFYGKNEPTANKVGDTWFKENPDGSATIHVWDGQTWKEVKTDYTKEFEQLDKELEEQKSNIDESLKNAEQAIEDAGFSKEQSQQALDESKKAIKDAEFSKGLSESTQKELIESNKEIEVAKKDANKAIKDAEKALNDLDNMEIGSTNLIKDSKNIIFRPNNQQINPIEYDATNRRVRRIEGSIALSTFTTEFYGDSDDVNQDYTETIWVKPEVDCNIFSMGSKDVFKCKKDEWTKVITHKKLTVSDRGERFSGLISSDIPVNKWVYIKYVQAEKGTVSTDWKRNLEDIEVELTNINGELKSKVSKKDFDELGNKVTSHDTQISQNEKEIALKANQSTVDGLDKKVTDNSAQIKVNSESINLKADKTIVDTINKTVESQGTQIKLNSDQLKLKAEKTYVDNKNNELDKKLSSQITVQSDKISANSKTITEQGTKIGKLEVESGKITSEITELKNQEIGGRNYFSKYIENYDPKGSYGYKHLGGGFNIARIKDKDTEVDISGIFFGFTKNGLNADGGVEWLVGNGNIYKTEILTDKMEYLSFFPKNQKTLNAIHDRFFVKFEKGNKATDWTLAPEDEEYRFSKIEQTIDGVQTTVSNKADKSEVTQLAGQLTSVVEDVQGNSSMINQNKEQIQEVIKSTDGKFVEVNKTIGGIQTTVEDKADKSQVTQLSGQITSVVKNNSVPNLITNSSMINRDYTGWELGNSWYISTVTRDGNGYLSANSTTDTLTRATNEYLEIRSNSKLSFSVESFIERISGGEWYIAIAFYDDDKKYISEKQIDLTDTPIKTYKTFNLDGFVVPSDSRYTRVAIIAKGDVWGYFGKPMLSQSDIAIPYRPSEVSQSQITQTKEMINLKVSKGDVVGQLNIDAGQTLIQNNKVVIDAKTTVIKGTSWMDGAVIKDATIGTAQIKNASITNAKIGSIDAGKLTAGTISTGDIKIASTLEITGENGSLNGHYDYKEEAAVEKRRLVGTWRQGWRDIQFKGTTYDLGSSYSTLTSTAFGQDTIKMRALESDGINVKQRIDMRVYKKAEIELVKYIKGTENWESHTRITPEYVRSSRIATSVVHNLSVSDDEPTNLSRFLYIYPSNPNDPSSAASAFAIRRNNADGEAAWAVRSDYIANSTGGGAYQVLISSSNYLKSSKYAYNASALNASKPMAMSRMRSVSSPSIMPNLDGIDKLTPSMWVDENRPKVKNTGKRMMRSSSSPQPIANNFVTGYTVEDLVDAGLTNAVLYDSETGEPDGINMSGLMPYIFENMKMLKMDNDMLRNRLTQLEGDFESINNKEIDDYYEDGVDPETGM